MNCTERENDPVFSEQEHIEVSLSDQAGRKSSDDSISSSFIDQSGLQKLLKSKENGNFVKSLSAMSSPPHSTTGDSWVELEMCDVLASQNMNIIDKSLQKLLLEAQKEGSSNSSSRNASNRTSPRGPSASSSPPLLVDKQMFQSEAPTEWTSELICQWSSLPDVMPPPGYMSKLMRPKPKKSFSLDAKSRRLDLFSRFPALLFSHACSFIMGAAIMFFYLKRYCITFTHN